MRESVLNRVLRFIGQTLGMAGGQGLGMLIAVEIIALIFKHTLTLNAALIVGGLSMSFIALGATLYYLSSK